MKKIETKCILSNYEQTMLEIYAIIPEHPNFAISNFGQILNIKKQKILKQSMSEGYKCVRLYDKFKRVHRLLAEAFIDNPENKPVVDHIDNDRSNNNLNNLRWATYKENGQNQQIRVDNTSGVKGVLFIKQSNKWRAEIRLNQKKYYLGRYKTMDEAKIARQLIANILFKEYTNEIEKQELVTNLKLKDIIKNKKVFAQLNINVDA